MNTNKIKLKKKDGDMEKYEAIYPKHLGICDSGL